jgi:transcription initiation factor IIE alpha subunit
MLAKGKDKYKPMVFYECPQCQHRMFEAAYFNVKFKDCPFCDTDLGIYRKKSI